MNRTVLSVTSGVCTKCISWRCTVVKCLSPEDLRDRGARGPTTCIQRMVGEGWQLKYHLRNVKSLFTDSALIKASLRVVRRWHGVISSQRCGCPRIDKGRKRACITAMTRNSSCENSFFNSSSIRHVSLWLQLQTGCGTRILDGSCQLLGYGGCGGFHKSSMECGHENPDAGDG